MYQDYKFLASQVVSNFSTYKDAIISYSNPLLITIELINILQGKKHLFNNMRLTKNDVKSNAGTNKYRQDILPTVHDIERAHKLIK